MPAHPYVPEAFPRRWLPPETELKTWDQIEPWYTKLVDREIGSTAELESWLYDVGELNAAVNQEGAKRYVAMTCQTDDPEREAAYLAFVRDIEPKLKPLQNALRERYVDSPHRTGLPRDQFHVFDRAQANRRELYRAANIPRETELAELEQQYQKTVGAMTVQFRGEERTPSQMAPFLEETDRALRKEAWELVAARRLVDRDTLDELFDRMLVLVDCDLTGGGTYNLCRITRSARASGSITALPRRSRFMTPSRSAWFHWRATFKKSAGARSGSKRCGRGISRSIRSGVRRSGCSAVGGRSPRGRRQSFRASIPSSEASSTTCEQTDLLDLANRKGKAPGGYQTTFEDDRLPFIFMNAVGLDGDLRTLLHEGGHAFHALASRSQKIPAYRESPIEFCEVASMSMELLGARDLGEFYDAADANRSYRQLLEGIVLILPWIATVDAFQQWIYTHPEHTRDERRGLAEAHDPVRRQRRPVSQQDARSNSWHRQLHIFLYPFYYIEYGIAQLGALQIWRRGLKDKAGAVASYRSALALGGSRPLPGFCRRDTRFSSRGRRRRMRRLMDAVRAELATLGP